MKGKKRIALLVFFLLGLSTLLFGAFVLYNTYRIDSFDGRTMVMGKVVDSEEAPLEGAEVSYDGRPYLTDKEGKFLVRDVEEGLVELEIYKPGYVRTTIHWIAYPMSDIDDELKDSANDISASFDIELKREMEVIEIDSYGNGTLTLEIFADPESNIAGLPLNVNGDDLELEPGLNSIALEGNGTFHILVGNEDPGNEPSAVTGFHPVGNIVNLTHEVSSAAEHGLEAYYKGSNSTMEFTTSSDRSHDNVSFVFKPLGGGESLEFVSNVDKDDPLSYQLPPGVYSLEITGRSVRDRTFRWLILNESEEKTLGLELVEGDTDSIYDLSLSGNYIVSGVYLVVAVLIFGGGYLLKRNGPWGWIVAAALLGFITQGFFSVLIFNINQVLTIILVVVLFYLRSDLNRIRERRRETKD